MGDAPVQQSRYRLFIESGLDEGEVAVNIIYFGGQWLVRGADICEALLDRAKRHYFTLLVRSLVTDDLCWAQLSVTLSEDD
jgi:hypothetical protein